MARPARSSLFSCGCIILRPFYISVLHLPGSLLLKRVLKSILTITRFGLNRWKWCRRSRSQSKCDSSSNVRRQTGIHHFHIHCRPCSAVVKCQPRKQSFHNSLLTFHVFHFSRFTIIFAPYGNRC